MMSDLIGTLNTGWKSYSSRLTIHTFTCPRKSLTHVAFPYFSPFSPGDLASYLRKQKPSVKNAFRWSNLHSFSFASFLSQWKRCPSIRVNSTTCTLDLILFFLKNLILSVISCEIAELKRLVFYFVLHLSNIKKFSSYLLCWNRYRVFKVLLFIDVRERKKH